MKGQYAQANRRVNSLIEQHGAKPELLLRRGLIQLSRRAPQAGVVINGASKATGLRNQEKFFNEVNKRLAANSSLPEGESVSLVKTGNRLDFHYRMDKPIGGSAVKPEEIKETRPLVYRQDDPSLNNLDWNVPIRQSLQTIVANNPGMVVRFTNESIARYRPAKITVSGGGQYRLVETAKTRNIGGGNKRKGAGAKTDAREIGDGECTPEQESRGVCRRGEAIYMILAKRDQ